MGEEWRDIPGYEGRYQVSDFGRLLGYAGRILHPQINNSGYCVAHLYLNGERSIALVHRLVAFAFIQIEQGREYVNHLNGDKLDNRRTNLEWCSNGENVLHAKANGLWAPYRHPVIGVHLETGESVAFACQRDAELALSGTGKQSGAIQHCLVGRKKSAYGYRWSRQ